jgi:hypothetical protein
VGQRDPTFFVVRPFQGRQNCSGEPICSPKLLGQTRPKTDP